MTKRLARIAALALATAAFALPAAPASAEIICLINEDTIGLHVCV
ncbi:MAG TPA: hypothetical protein VNQ77_04765 [Frankiaceae bacterium]|nr:hypothetical protein [Frankiaceae bacterium]